MLGIVHAFDFLDVHDTFEWPGLVALVGDEPLLKRLVLQRIQRAKSHPAGKLDADEGSDSEDSIVVVAGEQATWREVRDQMSSRSLFQTGRNVVVVRDADSFVSASRAELEDRVDDADSQTTLVLDVTTFPANTRLAKATAKKGLIITCRPPERSAGRRMVVDLPALIKWFVHHAKQEYQLNMAGRQVERVVELVGDHLGLIDSELSKLALFADAKGKVTDAQIDEVVGGWRTQTTWELLDAACDGNAGAAIRQLDQLIHAGEPPQALFGAISWSLRRFAAAVRFVQMQEQRGQRLDLAAALAEAGVGKYPVERFQRAVAHLRQIGRVRAARLYRQLLSADMKMKGSHSAPDRARFVLEELIFVLASGMAAKRV